GRAQVRGWFRRTRPPWPIEYPSRRGAALPATLASRPPRPTTLEIDLDAAAANVRAVRRLVGPARKLFAVVKADGYGHGAAEMGAVFLAHGADALAVADLAEGIRLRRRGSVAPVLVYPNSLPDAAPGPLA